MSDSQNCKTSKKHPLDWAIAIFLLFTLIATSIAACYTKRQWETAVDNEQRQVRAYVFLKDIEFEKRNDDYYDIIPEWENTGVSQTSNMHAHISWLMTNLDVPKDIGYGDVQKPSLGQADIVLGPKSISTITFGKLYSGCLDQFDKGDRINKFYIWGHVTYGDVLTDEQHITRFCWNVQQVVYTNGHASLRLSHALCEEGNCADHDCPTPENKVLELPQTICKNLPPANPVTPQPK